MVKFNVLAQSKEQSNGLTADSETVEFDWNVTPVIDDGGYILEVPDEGTRSG